MDLVSAKIFTLANLPSAGLLSLGSIALLAAGWLAVRLFSSVSSKLPPEDPNRLRKLAEKIQGLQWGPATTIDDLQKLVDALVELFQAEIAYYYNARASSRRISLRFRTAAFTLGTLGLLCPLVQPLLPQGFDWVSRLGYVFLAGAAASLAGNELFGGTRGHVRYVTTQYKLEELITQFLLDWSAIKANATVEQLDTAEPIKIMKTFAEACHKAVSDETKAWGVAIMQAAADYGNSVQKSRKR